MSNTGIGNQPFDSHSASTCETAVVGEVLLVLFVVLAVVSVITVVGHCLWLLVAMIGRALFGAASTASDQGANSYRGACPRCRRRAGRPERYCSSCGLDHASQEAAELRNLEATAREIQRLLENGVLEQAACEQFYTSIEMRLRTLAGKGGSGSLAPLSASRTAD